MIKRILLAMRLKKMGYRLMTKDMIRKNVFEYKGACDYEAWRVIFNKYILVADCDLYFGQRIWSYNTKVMDEFIKMDDKYFDKVRDLDARANNGFI